MRTYDRRSVPLVSLLGRERIGQLAEINAIEEGALLRCSTQILTHSTPVLRLIFTLISQYARLEIPMDLRENATLQN